MEDIVRTLQSVSPGAILALVFAIAFIENVFPPSPSDVLIVFGGSLIGMGRIGFLEVLVSATAGSTVGFLLMYAIGKSFGRKIIERGKLPFIPLDSLHVVEGWFRKYGYWIIVANRFLSGTRAVISFFAGVSEMQIVPTTILCGLSALAWNAILVTGGYYLGNNWERIGFYLNMYSGVVTSLIVLGILFVVVRYFLKRRNGKASS
jgi:membrane protein DedA with SNARE-associated domain